MIEMKNRLPEWISWLSSPSVLSTHGSWFMVHGQEKEKNRHFQIKLNPIHRKILLQYYCSINNSILWYKSLSLMVYHSWFIKKSIWNSPKRPHFWVHSGGFLGILPEWTHKWGHFGEFPRKNWVHGWAKVKPRWAKVRPRWAKVRPKNWKKNMNFQI